MLTAFLTAGFVFACSLAAGLLGIALKSRLHVALFDDPTKDVVRLVQALITSITALVLSLMIASASSHHRSQQDTVVSLSGEIVVLDRVLAHFGAAAGDSRAALRRIVEEAVGHAATRSSVQPGGEIKGLFDDVFARILDLSPQTDAQRIAKGKAVDLTLRMFEARAIMRARDIGGPVQKPFLVVVTAWLMLVFLAMGLFARRNTTTICALVAGAVATGGAMFLIVELEDTYSGLLRISDAPLRAALEYLGR